MQNEISTTVHDSSKTVSVIIPVYNPGPILEKCLESIINQSYRSLEIILINDGSSDNSDEICRRFADNDQRIVYISQLNSGVSATRNRGISTATGQYVCFIDSDDFVDPDYVSAMIDAATASDADIVIQGLKTLENDVVTGETKFNPSHTNVKELSEDLFDRIYNYAGPYCKLFKTELLRKHNITFPTDISYGEDAVFYFKYLEICQTIQLIANTAYNYRAFNQSCLTVKPLSPDKFWKNQKYRRKGYRLLRKAYGLPSDTSKNENFRKIVGFCGMLDSVFKSEHNDASIARYLDMIINDPDFMLDELRTSHPYHRILLSLVKRNNKASRWFLKKILTRH